MRSIICFFVKLHDCFFHFCEKYLSSILLLVIRLCLANIFFFSGYSKLLDFNTAIYLFRYEYKVPYLPPELAAYLGTGIELICGSLVALGLFTRLASLPILAMAIVIQTTYLQLSEHSYWMLLTSTLICFGAGKISMDYWLSNNLKGRACS